MIVTFERDIKNNLIELEKHVINSLEDSLNNNEDIEKAFSKILKIISKILYKTSLKHEEWHSKIQDDSVHKDGNHFTFFPGYITNAGKRIFNTSYFRHERDGLIHVINDKLDKHEEINLDFWYSSAKKIETTDNRISLLSIAYHLLFIRKKEDNVSSYFSPEIGGTHQWASINADEIAINDFLEPLELLAFYDNKRDARDNQLKYKSWISIPFELRDNSSIESIHNEIYEWCESVVNKLDYPSNRKNMSKSQYRWPYNPDAGLFNTRNEVLIYRAFIVAFWMEMVLSPDKLFDIENDKIESFKLQSNEVRAWFEFSEYFKKRANTSNDLNELIDFRQIQINNLKKILGNTKNRNQIIVQNYKYWYTIPFRHRLDLSPKSKLNSESRKETGSAMILSNYLLDEEYFRFVIPWLKQMYDAMREYDTAYQTSIDTSIKKSQEFNKAFVDVGLESSTIETINQKVNYEAKNYREH